jgi:hypothetical protein
MIGEFSLAGVFVPAFLVSAALAFLLVSVAKRVLRLARFYRLVWHPALFDASLFMIVWWGVSAATAGVNLNFSGGGL